MSARCLVWLTILVGCSSAPTSPSRTEAAEGRAQLARAEERPAPQVEEAPAAEAEAPASPCEGLSASEDPPLKLMLDQPRPGELRAVLCNTSSRPQRVLVSFMSQPLVLELAHPEDGPLEAYDERSVRGGSGRILESMFQTVEAGGEFELERAEVASAEADDGDTMSLRFGTLQFQSIAPAIYQATARMHARSARTADAGVLEDVWLGPMVSDAQTLRLPTPAE